jgi:hypothetical protein
LLAPCGEKPSIIAECLFVDPVTDIAVLGSPDNQSLPDEAEAYQRFAEAATALAIGVLPAKMFAVLRGWLRCHWADAWSSRLATVKLP